MQRKNPLTVVEIAAQKVVEHGYKVETIRQPVHPKPGYITFFDPLNPLHLFKINVVETFLELQDQLIDRLAEAQKELDAEKLRDECRNWKPSEKSDNTS